MEACGIPMASASSMNAPIFGSAGMVMLYTRCVGGYASEADFDLGSLNEVTFEDRDEGLLHGVASGLPGEQASQSAAIKAGIGPLQPLLGAFEDS